MNILDLENVICKITKQYNLSNATVVENILGWGGTLRVKINSGNVNYFAKEKVVYLKPSEFKYKTLFHQQLFALKAPVVPILNNNKNVPYTVVGGKLFELMPWVESVPLLGDSKDLYKISEALAIFQVAANKKFRNISPGKIWNYPKMRQQLFPDKSLNIKKYLKFFLNSKVAGLLKPTLVSKIIKLNSQLLECIEWNQLKTSWLHGDPGLDNALEYKGKVLFFDLDNIRVGYRIWDLVRLCALLGSFKTLNTSKKELHSHWKQTSMCDLISGFNSVIKLDKVECKNLSYLIGIHVIMNFIAEFDLDDSYDPTFKLFNQDMNNELLKLINLLETINLLEVI